MLPGEFDHDRIPAHLTMTVVVRDRDGREVARGRDARALSATLGTRIEAAFDEQVEGIADSLFRPGGMTFPEDPLPESLLVPGVAGRLVGWVALVERSEEVAARLLPDEARARVLHHQAVTRALVRLCGSSLSGHLDWLLEGRGLDSRQAKIDPKHPVRGEIESLIVDATFLPGTGSWRIRSQEQLERCHDAGFSRLSEFAEEVVDAVEGVLVRVAELRTRLEGALPSSWDPVLEPMRRSLRALVPTRLSDAGWSRVSRAPRLLEVLGRRLDRLAEKGATRELRDLEEILPWQQRLAAARATAVDSPAILAYELVLEDFAAHQVAPSLAPAGAGSLRRLGIAWNAVCTEHPRLEPVR